ncbi:hypothetical protein [Rhodopseudomonas faecalis]|uniref:hypothetical protein n=1 Tax=Rhodopseudomonas faecalis TaxID=99655 RepID=UPI0011B4B0AD|nr:hypothetical protein [Rhodopseudomonas faecalis]
MRNIHKPRQQVHSDSRRYFILIDGKLCRYTPKPGEPAAIAIRHQGQWRLIFTGYTDAEYFASYPHARGRFTVQQISHDYFHWRYVSRGGGEMSGDSYDLFDTVQWFRSATPINRLRRTLRRLALRDCHRVIRNAPDLVSSLRFHA